MLPAEEHKQVKACLNGDRQAWKALYEAHKDKLFALCLRYTYDRSEAEDVLQEGFIKIFRDLHQWRGEGQVGAWMRKVMLHTVLGHMRKFLSPSRMSTVTFEDQTQLKVDAVEPWEPSASGLIQLMHQLAPGYRTVLNLYVMEEYSHEEISKELGISISTSKSQLSRAKDQLRKLMENALILSNP